MCARVCDHPSVQEEPLPHPSPQLCTRYGNAELCRFQFHSYQSALLRQQQRPVFCWFLRLVIFSRTLMPTHKSTPERKYPTKNEMHRVSLDQLPSKQEAVGLMPPSPPQTQPPPKGNYIYTAHKHTHEGSGTLWHCLVHHPTG